MLQILGLCVYILPEDKLLTEFPKYMQPGSKGPHTVALQAFLVGYASGGKKGFKTTGIFDEATTKLVKNYQRDAGLEQDGGFGPDTRGVAQDDGFDFHAACMLIPGITVFVQPDGSEIKWSPDEDVLAAANEPRLAAPYDE